MGSGADRVAGPDLAKGIPVADFHGGRIVAGEVDGEAVVVARSGKDYFAVGASCTHYGGPLAEGLVVDGTIRCPWHHACFDLKSGEAIGAPAFDPIPCYGVERRGDRVFVTGRLRAAVLPRAAGADEPKRIVIVGGGAAGFAAAEMLRRRGYAGSLAMLSADADAPCDRPNLSKDYLAGTAPEEWIPLRPESFYADNRIDLHLGTRVERIDAGERQAVAADGRRFAYDRLLLATGAEPVRLKLPGADRPHVFVLRSLADSRALKARAASARSAVVVGAGFIGLEAAASLRALGIDVHVVAPEALPLQKILGDELATLVRGLHEKHGVRFHLRDQVVEIGDGDVTLKGGERLAADLVVVGVGVRPRTGLGESAGAEIGSGIRVDAHMRTRVPGVYAAGDVAEWVDEPGGEPHRVEHWVVAERQGQVAALDMLGEDARYTDAPFFWSAHYDVTIRYVGLGKGWEVAHVAGDVAQADATVSYRRGGRTIAVAAVGRDRQALEAALHLSQR